MTEPVTYLVLRPPDLVRVTVTAVGLAEQEGAAGPELVSTGPGGRLVVEFAAQHIAETAPPPGSSSSEARPAGPSRLEFPVDDRPIPLSGSGLLAAMGRLRPVPGTAADGSTLEIPWRVLLGLVADTTCVHRAAPATGSGGVTELWHTRLLADGGAYASVSPLRTLPLGGDAGFAGGTPLGGFFDRIDAQAAAHPGQPMAVDRLILSASGAWFGGSISWRGDAGELDWTHRAAMGRDFYVRVLETGVLFPFGHRASFVETYERRFESGDAPVAVLRGTRSLVITEPARDFDLAERQFPFQHVELAPLMVDGLDQPADTTTFWPTRGGAPVLFSVHARAAGDVVEMALPLLFHAGAGSDQLDAVYAQGPGAVHDAAAGRPRASVGRFMAVAVKSATEAFDGAVQHVRSLTFGGKPVADGPGFHPVVTGLEVMLPAVRQLLGADGILNAQLSDELLQTPAGAEVPDVLLKFDTLPLKFGSARAGVVAAPNMNVNRISRTLGPITDRLPTDPAELFPPDANLLGVFPLRELISRISPEHGRPTITWSGGDHPVATLTWAQELTQQSGPFAPTPGATCQVGLTVTTKPAAANGGPPPVVTDGTVSNFTLSIPPQDTLVELDFRELKFHAETGALPTTSFSIGGARLTGSLAFVQKLQQALPQVGDSAPAIEVSDKAIKATFAAAVPSPLSMGAFTLRNIRLQAAITLSFVNEPVLVEFSFASREQPFLVAVSAFGGGGYLELAIGAGDSGGLQRFVGSLEFGACAAMDFGVASGEVHVFGGVTFTKQGSAVEITGYLRIGGMVRVLGLVSVSVELTIAMTYVPNMLTGSARLVISVDLTFWSTSVEIGCSKSFGGSEPAPPVHGGNPVALVAFMVGPEPGFSVQEALGPDTASYPWQTYCQAFAPE
ncbi:hypothetical protein [Streptomyces sp. Y1]|uniref:Uncharacterized protein n=1 Tax=Streptomyces sp. Y1 TaxID=3238634 RepID=A0AB39TEM3_9ACTN